MSKYDFEKMEFNLGCAIDAITNRGRIHTAFKSATSPKGYAFWEDYLCGWKKKKARKELKKMILAYAEWMAAKEVEKAHDEWIVTKGSIEPPTPPQKEANSMAFEAGKEYLTRDGQKARIYAVDGGGKYPIHGAYWRAADKRWKIEMWQEDGRFLCVGESSLDIMLPQKEVQLNVYPKGLY